MYCAVLYCTANNIVSFDLTMEGSRKRHVLCCTVLYCTVLYCKYYCLF